jgi:glycosyltransferase involved in cell wall biosynthesis
MKAIRSLYLASDRLQSWGRLGVRVAQSAWPGTALENRLAAAIEALPKPTVGFVPGRVLLVNTTLSAGGAERQILATLIGLSGRPEIESIALVTGAMTEPGQRFHLAGLEATGIEVVSTAGIDRPLADHAEALFAQLPAPIAALARGWYEIFRERRPEIVHAWQDATSVAAGLAALAAGVPKIVLAGRNLSPIHFVYWRPYLRPCYRAMVRQPDVRLINNSQAGARDYAAWLDVPADRFAVLRNGFSPDGLARAQPSVIASERRRLGISDGALVIGSVFRFYPEKRPTLWLEMALAVTKRLPAVHVVLVGWGPLEPMIRRTAETLIQSGRLHLVPATSQVTPLLSIMDVFVLTSRFEGTPNVLIEAQSLGVPVVATPGGGTEEALQEGATGWLARSDSVVELTELVVSLLADAPRRAAAAERGPAFVAERFGMARMLDETLARYGLTGRTR